MIEGLPRNRAFLDDLARALKTACGAGGKAEMDRIEIQGDQRERIREVLSARGFRVLG
jgi:translation initiation factor 1